MRKRAMATGMMVMMVLLVSAGFSAAQAADLEHDFAGTKKCGMCHKKAADGDQFGKWSAGPHARAFKTLETPEAKAAAAEMGIDNPQTSGKCLKCHATSYYYGEESMTAVLMPEEGVSCESCHGPGKDYMKMSVMKDPEAAHAAGLVTPDAATCVKCHNEESPTYKGFNFEEAWAKIDHSKP